MENSTKKYDENEYIVIPNPIYDVVFKYLMEDTESATIVISTLINQKIKNLRLEPLTHAEKNQFDEPIEITDPKTNEDIRLFHLDFTATIEFPDGKEELIMIELQKASIPEDIFRFKRYISRNFQKKIVLERQHPSSGGFEEYNKPIRLVPIFILNYKIENEINDLLIHINRTKNGVFTNKTIGENPFLDNLTYDLWIVQLPNLQNIKEEDYANDEYKQKLYSLLKIFDQKSKVKGNEHRLRLIRKFFPGFLDRVIKRLQAASSNNNKLEDQMFAEDEYLQTLIKRDNAINQLEEILEKKLQVITEKEQVITEKEQVITEKEQVITEKEQVITEKEQVITEKEQVILAKEKVIEHKNKELKKNKLVIMELAKTLKDNNVPIDVIEVKTGLSIDIIENL